jgi:hypothetical protein
MARRGVKLGPEEEPEASAQKAMPLRSSYFSLHHGTMCRYFGRWHCCQHLEESHLCWRIGVHHRAYVQAQTADRSQVKGQ